MKDTFFFIIQSLMNLFDNSFYLIPLIFCSFVLLLRIVDLLLSFSDSK